MTMTTESAHTNSQHALLAILREAKIQGIQLTRTALVKYAYLLDVCVAQETGGHPLTAWEWTFHHYGPWTRDITADLQALARMETVVASPRKSSAGNNYVLYSLDKNHGHAPRLSELDLPVSACENFVRLLVRYGNNLSSLMYYVYFHTEPMAMARSGDKLNFHSCQREEREAYRPVDMNEMSEDSIARIQAKLQEELNKKERALAETRALFDEKYYDEAYFRCEALMSDTSPMGLDGVARIAIETAVD